MVAAPGVDLPFSAWESEDIPRGYGGAAISELILAGRVSVDLVSMSDVTTFWPKLVKNLHPGTRNMVKPHHIYEFNARFEVEY